MQPFERRSGLSEVIRRVFESLFHYEIYLQSECLSLCRSMSNCQSLIYSAQRSVCDLYMQQIDLSYGYGSNAGSGGRD